MPTRRKPTLLAQGKPRTLGGSTRPWASTSLRAGRRGTEYQVMFHAPNRRRRAVEEGAAARELRGRGPADLRAGRARAQHGEGDPVGADVRSTRTIRMLGEGYLKDSIERGKQPRTMEQRISRLNALILPTIGDVPVAKWRVEHSRRVMEKGSKTLFSQRGREDLRGQLTAMRKLASRLGWLDRSIDPLDGLEIGRTTVHHGATAQYVDPRGCARRPARSRRWQPLPSTCADPMAPTRECPASPCSAPRSASPASAAFASASRTRSAQPTSSSITATSTSMARGSPPAGLPASGTKSKNQTTHEVPLPKSLMHDELIPRVKELLGLPAEASLQQVVNAQEAERQRRASLATRSKDRNLTW